MAGTWTTQAPMSGPRAQLGVVGFPSAVIPGALPPGSLLATAGIYAVGGSLQKKFLSRTERFDIAANAWTTKADMPTARADFALAAAHTWMYAIGGFGAKGACMEVERFDPTLGALGTWTPRAPLPASRWAHGAAAVLVGNRLRLYVIGGNNSIWLKDVLWCEITANGEGAWNTAPSLNIPREHFGVAVVGNTIVCVGGYTDTGAEASIEVLAANAGSWTLHKNVLKTARYGCGAAYSGGLIFAVGGNDANGPTKSVEAFDASTFKSSGTWTNAPAARTQFGTGCIPLFIVSPKDTLPIFVAGGIVGNAATPQSSATRFDP
jgi:hypothetical protein